MPKVTTAGVVVDRHLLMQKAMTRCQSALWFADTMTGDIWSAKQNPKLCCMYTWSDVERERKIAYVWAAVYGELRSLPDPMVPWSQFQAIASGARERIRGSQH